jgi:hypothetical protein
LKSGRGRGLRILRLCTSMAFSSTGSPAVCVAFVSSMLLALNVKVGSETAFGFRDNCRRCAREGEEGGLLGVKGDGGERAGETETEVMLGNEEFDRGGFWPAGRC